jgi:hypothetical protein
VALLDHSRDPLAKRVAYYRVENIDYELPWELRPVDLVRQVVLYRWPHSQLIQNVFNGEAFVLGCEQILYLTAFDESARSQRVRGGVVIGMIELTSSGHSQAVSKSRC